MAESIDHGICDSFFKIKSGSTPEIIFSNYKKYNTQVNTGSVKCTVNIHKIKVSLLNMYDIWIP